MHRLAVSALVMLGVCLSAGAVRGDDLVQPGTRWVGSLKKADVDGKGKKKRISYTSTEYVLIITSRDGEKFEAEVNRGKEPRRTKVKGTIDKKGIADFRVTERLKGAARDDVVDNARHHGTFKDDKYIGKLSIPGNDPLIGEIKLTLEKPDKK